MGIFSNQTRATALVGMDNKELKSTKKGLDTGVTNTCWSHEDPYAISPKGSDKCNRYISVARDNPKTVGTRAMYSTSGLSFMTGCFGGLWDQGGTFDSGTPSTLTRILFVPVYPVP